jgi:hypothetical protein
MQAFAPKCRSVKKLTNKACVVFAAWHIPTFAYIWSAMRYVVHIVLLLLLFQYIYAQRPVPFEGYFPPSIRYETYQYNTWDSAEGLGIAPRFKTTVNVLIKENKPYDGRTFEFYITNLSDTPLICEGVRYILSNLKVNYLKDGIPPGKTMKLATIQISSPSPQVPFVKWCELVTSRGVIMLQFRQRGLETISEH